MLRETESVVQVLKAHVALNVRSVERSREFYQKMLGIEPSKVRAGYAKFDVANPPLNLTLNEAQFKERGALSHMGLQVAKTDDVLAMRERWALAGLLTRDEMGTNCCYALQDKTWVRDPDGNEWEVFVVLEDNLAETSLCCTTSEATEALDAQEASSSCSTEATGTGEANACCGTKVVTSAPVSLSR